MNFITPFYDCRLRAFYQITNQALANLQEERVTSSVRRKLASIKDKEGRKRKEFLDLLKATIGRGNSDRYGSLILKHAKISDNRICSIDVTLSAPPQTDPTSVVDKLIRYLETFKITYEDLKRLRLGGVPSNVLVKLARIKDQEIEKKREFLSLIKTTIGKARFPEYKPIILKQVKCFANKDFKIICDFGAGKLRNVRPFLEKKFTVYAVDYEEQFQYKKTIGMEGELQRDFPKRFKSSIFPEDFETLEIEFDIVLLIFVTHIIPSQDDRKLIIKMCSEKLRKDGLLIWVTPKDTKMKRLCKDQFRYKDGFIFRAESRSKKKTFYTEFQVPQIDEMVERHRLKFIDRFDLHKNPGRIYEKY